METDKSRKRPSIQLVVGRGGSESDRADQEGKKEKKSEKKLRREGGAGERRFCGIGNSWRHGVFVGEGGAVPCSSLYPYPYPPRDGKKTISFVHRRG
jgi:hypothetical protein